MIRVLKKLTVVYVCIGSHLICQDFIKSSDNFTCNGFLHMHMVGCATFI